MVLRLHVQAEVAEHRLAKARQDRQARREGDRAKRCHLRAPRVCWVRCHSCVLGEEEARVAEEAAGVRRMDGQVDEGAGRACGRRARPGGVSAGGT